MIRDGTRSVQDVADVYVIIALKSMPLLAGLAASAAVAITHSLRQVLVIDGANTTWPRRFVSPQFVMLLSISASRSSVLIAQS